MALYLELDQCSNSRTHQDFAPTKTHMEVHILSNGIKQQRIGRIQIETEQKMESKAGNTNLIGTNGKKHQAKLIYRMELKENERRTLIEGACWILRIGEAIHATWFLVPR